MNEFEKCNLEHLTRIKNLEGLLGVGKEVHHALFGAAAVPGFYTLSPDRITATKTGFEKRDRWAGFLSEQPLSALGNKFTVEVNNVSS